MPELPEVETVVRSLAPLLVGRVILSVELTSPRVSRGRVAEARGRRILHVHRYGKYILIELDAGTLTVHLGMTGRLLWNAVPGRHTRARIQLDSGTVLFDDPRQFGRMEWTPETPARLALLGPEPLQISFREFQERLRSRRGRVKSVLLNQRFLRGLGNIYADESLFRARIHPLAMAAQLSTTRARRLYDAIREVLTEAIAKRGTSISDYVDGSGQQGSFQGRLRVYRRKGEPCLRCGATIRRMVVAQRGTYFCPHCQR